MKGSQHSYQELKARLLTAIKTEEWLPESRIPSERQLAELYATSRSTVRRAIAEMISEGYLHAVPGSGTFVKAPVGERDHAEEHFTIAFLVCTRGRPDYTVTSNLFYAQVLRGVEREARRLGYHCVVATIDELDFQHSALDEMLRKVDGLVIGELRSQTLLGYLEEQQIPTVLISPSVDSSRCDTVELDNERGSLRAMGHLVQLGHQRIAYLGGSLGSKPAAQRLDGYRQGLVLAGLPYRQELVKECGWKYTRAQAAMDELLATTEFTAVFAASDNLAIAAMQRLQRAGFAVPGRVSVIGFDDLETAVQQNPPLASICVHKEFMGEFAVRTLVERMGVTREFGLKTVLPSHVLTRESTAPCRPPGKEV